MSTLDELSKQNDTLKTELTEASDKIAELTNAAAATAQAHDEEVNSLKTKIAALEEKITALEKQVKNKMTRKSRGVIRAKLVDDVARKFHGASGQSNTERAATAVDTVLETLFPEKAAADDDDATN